MALIELVIHLKNFMQNTRFNMTSIITGYLKFIALIIASIVTVYILYYSIWFLCLLNDSCYNQNFNIQ